MKSNAGERDTNTDSHQILVAFIIKSFRVNEFPIAFVSVTRLYRYIESPQPPSPGCLWACLRFSGRCERQEAAELKISIDFAYLCVTAQLYQRICQGMFGISLEENLIWF